jgi:uncharacterized caspase-like protein
MRCPTQSRFRLISLGVLAILYSLWFCPAVPAAKTAPEPGEPVANFPRMTVGDQWVLKTFRGVRSCKVIEVKPDGGFTLEVTSGDGAVMWHHTYDSNYRLVGIENKTTGKTMKTPSPPAKHLDFPLFVGKKWEDEFYGLALDDSYRTFKNSYEVEKVEKVSTPAGEVSAFKIRRRYTVDGGKKITDQYYWYSPELKITVKIHNSADFETKAGIPVFSELINYPRQVQPAVAAVAKEAARTASAPAVAAPSSVVGARWAVIIGISQYKDTRIASLRYAAADARSFYDWIVSPTGGRYAPAMVTVLLDAKATGTNIRKALFEWLAQAIEEDTVTIYFAGHGSPQSPDHPENLFLLPYDTQYDSVATTGFPMWDIETALKRFIKAKRVIVITDACHAGGVGQAFDVARRSGRGLNVVPMSSSLQNLSKIGEGVCIISASEDNQMSQEGSQWGGGHGVFTFHLLEGLKGKADYNKDGVVSLGELIPFLSEQIRRETRNAQSPTVAGRFDPSLSIGK